MTGTNEVTTFSDIFKNSFMKLLPTTIDPWTLVLTMLVALAVGIGIFLVYRKCFIGVVYDHAFNLSLVIMTVLVSVIIVTISSNVTLSLGMVGTIPDGGEKSSGSDVFILGDHLGDCYRSPVLLRGADQLCICDRGVCSFAFI